MASWSGFWNDHGATGPYAPIGKHQLRRKLAKMSRRRGYIPTLEIIDMLLADSTPASTAEYEYTRVKQSAGYAGSGPAVGGGKITIETVTMIDRAVAASDVTSLRKVLPGGSETDVQPTYPVDRSGNGGGGMLSSKYLLGH